MELSEETVDTHLWSFSDIHIPESIWTTARAFHTSHLGYQERHTVDIVIEPGLFRTTDHPSRLRRAALHERTADCGVH